MVSHSGPLLAHTHRAFAPALISAITGTPFVSRAALMRALHSDRSGTLHRSILTWLGLSSRMRPALLRRLPRQGLPSRRATRSLLSMLATVARAYLLFQDMDAVRRWLSRLARWAHHAQPTYPLAEVDSPQNRRRLVSMMRRTAHGLF
jgi:hypothetical protein